MCVCIFFIIHNLTRILQIREFNSFQSINAQHLCKQMGNMKKVPNIWFVQINPKPWDYTCVCLFCLLCTIHSSSLSSIAERRWTQMSVWVVRHVESVEFEPVIVFFLCYNLFNHFLLCFSYFFIALGLCLCLGSGELTYRISIENNIDNNNNNFVLLLCYSNQARGRSIHVKIYTIFFFFGGERRFIAGREIRIWQQTINRFMIRRLIEIIYNSSWLSSACRVTYSWRSSSDRLPLYSSTFSPVR